MDFFNPLVEFFSSYGYFAVLFVLLLCGFGLPIPEDITLVAGGVIAGLGKENEHIMVLIGLSGVLIGDGTVFLMGKTFGEKILKTKFFSKIITPSRFLKVQEKVEKYGDWVIFFARFMPGLRMPIYLTTGTSNRMSLLRFLILDFLAAIISVPIWVYLGFYGAKNFDWLKVKIHQGQIAIISTVGFILLIILLRKWLKKKQT